jgi:hypothetical protein
MLLKILLSVDVYECNSSLDVANDLVEQFAIKPIPMACMVFAFAALWIEPW